MVAVPSVILQKLGQLLRETSERELLPRFRNLAAADVIGKPSLDDPSDVVTVADRSAEAFLSERLSELLRGSVVIAASSPSWPAPKPPGSKQITSFSARRRGGLPSGRP